MAGSARPPWAASARPQSAARPATTALRPIIRLGASAEARSFGSARGQPVVSIDGRNAHDDARL